MNRPRSRRDFVLDTGALIYFAANPVSFRRWIEHLKRSYEAPSVFVPAPVLTEWITGDPRRDVGANRLLATITDPDQPERHLLTPSALTFARAGALRTLAISKRREGSKHLVSPTDAQVVALAEERSVYTAVVVATSDPGDIQLLVDLTGARNIGVWTI